MEPSSFELAAIEKLLAGSHPVLAALREQVPGLRVTARDHTGVGYFADFVIVGGSARLSFDRLILDDVEVSIPGLEGGAGVILHIDNGVIGTLEAFTYLDERWPDRIDEFALTYSERARAPILAELRR